MTFARRGASTPFQSFAERARRISQSSALARRNARWNVRVQWLGDKVQQNIALGMLRRLKLTAQLLRDKVVINLSVPVRKITKARVTESGDIVKVSKGGTTIVDPNSRSQPGEFPRADTTRLMKDIFWEIDDRDKNNPLGIVGTTLDYGLRLELHMNRSFLRRTLFEEATKLGAILGSPGGGAAGPLPGQTA